MSVLFLVVFGLMVGAVVRLIMPTRDPGGWTTSMLLGILGAFMGGLLGELLGTSNLGRAVDLLLSVLVTVVLVIGYSALMRRRAAP